MNLAKWESLQNSDVVYWIDQSDLLNFVQHYFILCFAGHCVCVQSKLSNWLYAMQLQLPSDDDERVKARQKLLCRPCRPCRAGQLIYKVFPGNAPFAEFYKFNFVSLVPLKIYTPLPQQDNRTLTFSRTWPRCIQLSVSLLYNPRTRAIWSVEFIEDEG